MPTPEPKAIDHFENIAPADARMGRPFDCVLDRVGDDVLLTFGDGCDSYGSMKLTDEQARRLARSLDAATVDRISPRQWSPSEAASMFAHLISDRAPSLRLTIAKLLGEFILDNELHQPREGFAHYRVRPRT